VLEIGDDVHFHFLGTFCFCLSFCQAAIRCLTIVSALVANGPDEAQQFTSNCNCDLFLVLAGCCQAHVTLVEPVLRLPCNLFSLFGNTLLSFAQAVPDAWWTMIAPGSFDDDSSQMRVARFGDAPAPGPLATGVFAGHGTAVTHQLPSTVKAGHLAQLGRDGHSRDICDTLQCLQIVDDFL
jgi:hypothetical protein